MPDTLIDLKGLVGEEELQALVDEVSCLSTSSVLVLDTNGELLSMAGRLPEGCSIASNGSAAAKCTMNNCGFSNRQVDAPIEIQGEVVGHVLVCSEGERTREVNEMAARLASDIIAGRAYGECELNNLSSEILERYEEVNLLYDIGETLGAVFDVETIYRITMEKITEIIGAQKAWIMVLGREGQGLQLVASNGISEEEKELLAVEMSRGICSAVIADGKPLLIETPEQMPSNISREGWIDKDKSPVSFPVMCVPLKTRERILGVINMSGKDSGEVFSAGDLKLTSAIASQAAISIHNSQLIEELKESERVKRDMEIAERIQKTLLPKAPPHFEGLDIAGRCVPAKNIGGDYYDFLAISEDELGIVIADVSGHSIGSALVMATTRSVLRSEVWQNDNASDVLARTNAIMYDDLSAAELFITMSYVRFNRQKGVLSYANGGHTLPFIYSSRERRCSTIDADGIVLGVLEEACFGQGEKKLGAGDILILYTDGITEAVNSNGEQFGEERLYRIVEDNNNLSAQALLDEIYRQVYKHSGDVVQNDDITMVVMKVTDS